ncbi:hypothetical protein KUV57_12290 [Epibacterium sp. DP7N7-1]|nr:hypothetical protein [Epibacterium sp. DP7N7-1]
MTISINRKQITTLAKAFEVPGASYLQKLDLIATSLGFKNQAALMAILNSDGAVAAAPEPATLQDWRQPGDVNGEDAPIQSPIPVKIDTSIQSVDILLGGCDEDPHGPQAASVRIEREGAVTRVMIYDSLCDAPRVFGVPDGATLRELPNDWEHTEPASASNAAAFKPETDDFDLVTWPNGDWCRREDLEIFGQHMSDDYVIIPISDYEIGQEDEVAAKAHSWPKSEDIGLEP